MRTALSLRHFCFREGRVGSIRKDTTWRPRPRQMRFPRMLQPRCFATKTRLMLQALLAERFHLTIRRETKEMSVYELVVAKNGPKLQKSERDCAANDTACHWFSGNPTRLLGTGVDMSDLALILSHDSGRPVLDKTGIPGLFDMKLQWNPFAGRPQPVGD